MVGSIWITLGGGAEFGINEQDQLILREGDVEISLGKATQKRFDAIVGHMSRLREHMEESSHAQDNQSR